MLNFDGRNEREGVLRWRWKYAQSKDLEPEILKLGTFFSSTRSRKLYIAEQSHALSTKSRISQCLFHRNQGYVWFCVHTSVKNHRIPHWARDTGSLGTFLGKTRMYGQHKHHCGSLREILMRKELPTSMKSGTQWLRLKLIENHWFSLISLVFNWIFTNSSLGTRYREFGMFFVENMNVRST